MPSSRPTQPPPTRPTQPARPARPTQPTRPTQPARPTRPPPTPPPPTRPSRPTQPTRPTQPPPPSQEDREERRSRQAPAPSRREQQLRQWVPDEEEAQERNVRRLSAWAPPAEDETEGKPERYITHLGAMGSPAPQRYSVYLGQMVNSPSPYPAVPRFTSDLEMGHALPRVDTSAPDLQATGVAGGQTVRPALREVGPRVPDVLSGAYGSENELEERSRRIRQNRTDWTLQSMGIPSIEAVLNEDSANWLTDTSRGLARRLDTAAEKLGINRAIEQAVPATQSALDFYEGAYTESKEANRKRQQAFNDWYFNSGAYLKAKMQSQKRWEEEAATQPQLEENARGAVKDAIATGVGVGPMTVSQAGASAWAAWKNLRAKTGWLARPFAATGSYIADLVDLGFIVPGKLIYTEAQQDGRGYTPAGIYGPVMATAGPALRETVQESAYLPPWEYETSPAAAPNWMDRFIYAINAFPVNWSNAIYDEVESERAAAQKILDTPLSERGDMAIANNNATSSTRAETLEAILGQPERVAELEAAAAAAKERGDAFLAAMYGAQANQLRNMDAADIANQPQFVSFAAELFEGFMLDPANLLDPIGGFVGNAFRLARAADMLGAVDEVAGLRNIQNAESAWQDVKPLLQTIPGVTVDDLADAAKAAPSPGVGEKAMWRHGDVEEPVEVTGMLGEHGGVRYYSIKGSTTGIPETELVFDAAKAAPSPAAAPPRFAVQDIKAGDEITYVDTGAPGVTSKIASGKVQSVLPDGRITVEMTLADGSVMTDITQPHRVTSAKRAGTAVTPAAAPPVAKAPAPAAPGKYTIPEGAKLRKLTTRPKDERFSQGPLRFFGQTKESLAQARTSEAFAAVTDLIAPIEGITATDARHILTTLINDPAQLVRGIPAAGFTTPQLLDMAASDGLIRFGPGLVAPSFLENYLPILRIAAPDILSMPHLLEAGALDKRWVGALDDILLDTSRRFMGSKVPDIPAGTRSIEVQSTGRTGKGKKATQGPPNAQLVYKAEDGTELGRSAAMPINQAKKQRKQTLQAAARATSDRTGFTQALSMPMRAQRAIMTDLFLGLSPRNWVKNAASAYAHMFADGEFTLMKLADARTNLEAKFGAAFGDQRVMEAAAGALESGATDVSSHWASRFGPVGKVWSRVAEWGLSIPYGDKGIKIGNIELPVGEQNFYSRIFANAFQRNFAEAWPTAVNRNFVYPMLKAGVPAPLVENIAQTMIETGIAGGKGDVLKAARKIINDAYSLPTLKQLGLPENWLPPQMAQQLLASIAKANGQYTPELEASINALFDAERAQAASMVGKTPPQPGVTSYTATEQVQDMADTIDRATTAAVRSGVDPQEAKRTATAEAAAVHEAENKLVAPVLNDLKITPGSPQSVDVVLTFWQRWAGLRETKRIESDTLWKNAYRTIVEIENAGAGVPAKSAVYAQTRGKVTEIGKKYLESLRTLTEEARLAINNDEALTVTDEARALWQGLMDRFSRFNPEANAAARTQGIPLGGAGTPEAAVVIDAWREYVDTAYVSMFEAARRTPTYDIIDHMATAEQRVEDIMAATEAKVAQLWDEMRQAGGSADDWQAARENANEAWAMAFEGSARIYHAAQEAIENVTDFDALKAATTYQAIEESTVATVRPFKAKGVTYEIVGKVNDQVWRVKGSNGKVYTVQPNGIGYPPPSARMAWDNHIANQQAKGAAKGAAKAAEVTEAQAPTRAAAPTAQAGPQPTRAADVQGPKPEQRPQRNRTAQQNGRLYEAGKDLYGAGWEQKRPQLVGDVTKGRTTSSKDLTYEEAETLITEMWKKINERNRAPMPPATRDNMIKALTTSGRIPQKEAEGVVALVEANANAWARWTGRAAQEYYDNLFQGFQVVTGPKSAPKPGGGRVQGALGMYAKAQGGKGGIVYLFQNAEPQTLVHEVWHHFEEVMLDAATDNPRVYKQYETLTEWAVGESNRLNAAGLRQGDQYPWRPEEVIAEAGVHYLREGRVPVEGLRGVFEQFKTWFKDIYDYFKGNLKLPDETRRIFDSWFDDSADIVRAADEVAPAAPNAPRGAVGRRTEGWTDPANPVPMQYQVVEADSLVASNFPDGRINPSYPGELQPRDRTQAASRLQTQQMAQKLAPEELLSDTNAIDRGSPIVGPNNVVLSGNGRTMAIGLASPQTYAKYREKLMEALHFFGIERVDVESMDKPVLVRQWQGQGSMVDFARQANERATLSMNAAETGKALAKRMDSELLASLDAGGGTGGVMLRKSLANEQAQDFINRMMKLLPNNERAGFIGADGGMTVQGRDLIRSALFSVVFEDDTVLRNYILAAVPDLANVGNGFEAAIVKLARLQRSNPDLALGDALSEAATTLMRLRDERMSVEQFLAQGSMFGGISDEGKLLLAFLDGNIRSGKAIGEGLNRYADAALRYAPNQVAMFDDMVAPSRPELLAQIMEETPTSSQAALFQPPPPRIDGFEGDEWNTDLNAGWRANSLKAKQLNGNVAPQMGAVASDTIRRMEEARKAVLDNLRKWTPQPNQLSGQQKLAAIDALQDTLTRWDNILEASRWMGTQAGEFAMLNYSRQRNFDVLLSMVMPYHYFWSRSAGNWMQRLARKPSLLNLYWEVESQLQENERQNKLMNEGDPARAAARVGLPGGEWFVTNPLNIFLPMNSYFANEFIDPDTANNSIERAWLNMRKWTPIGGPLFDLAVGAIFDQTNPREGPLSRTDEVGIGDIAPQVALGSAWWQAATGNVSPSWVSGDPYRIGTTGREIASNPDLTLQERQWALDIGHQLQNAVGPLPEQPEEAERIWTEAARQAGLDKAWAMTAAFLLGLPFAKVPANERAAKQAQNTRRTLGWNEQTNPYGSNEAKRLFDQQTGDVSLSMAQYPQLYPSRTEQPTPADRPGYAALRDKRSAGYDALKAEETNAINLYYRTNAGLPSAEIKAGIDQIRADYAAKRDALKQQYAHVPGPDIDPRYSYQQWSPEEVQKKALESAAAAAREQVQDMAIPPKPEKGAPQAEWDAREAAYDARDKAEEDFLTELLMDGDRLAGFVNGREVKPYATEAEARAAAREMMADISWLPKGSQALATRQSAEAVQRDAMGVLWDEYNALNLDNGEPDWRARRDYIEAHPGFDNEFKERWWEEPRDDGLTWDEYDAKVDEAKTMFGADIMEVWDGYDKNWPKAQKNAYFDKYPQLSNFFDWWFDDVEPGTGTGGGGGGAGAGFDWDTYKAQAKGTKDDWLRAHPDQLDLYLAYSEANGYDTGWIWGSGGSGGGSWGGGGSSAEQQEYLAKRAEAEAMFGAGIWDIVDGYNKEWPKAQKAAYFDAHPELQQFWDFWYGNEEGGGGYSSGYSGGGRGYSGGGGGYGGAWANGGSWMPEYETYQRRVKRTPGTDNRPRIYRAGDLGSIQPRRIRNVR